MTGLRRKPLSTAAASEDGQGGHATVVRASPQVPSWGRQTLAVVGLLLCLAVVWESVKAIGGDPWRLATEDGEAIHVHFQPPLSFAFASDLNMPHLWDIAGAFLQPARRHGPLLISVLIDAALFTMGEAVVGFALGSLLGLGLGTVFAHAPLLERSLMPYVVASQTVPILAIAPMVVIWLQAGWWSVAIIAAYLNQSIRDWYTQANPLRDFISFYHQAYRAAVWSSPHHDLSASDVLPALACGAESPACGLTNTPQRPDRSRVRSITATRARAFAPRSSRQRQSPSSPRRVPMAPRTSGAWPA